MKLTKIIIYTCVWKRPSITRICFDGIKRLINQLPYECSAHVCVSESWAEEMAKEYGFSYTVTENKPVGRKHNKGLFDVISNDFDYILHIGSDDIIDIRLFDLYAPYIEKRLDLIGVGQAYLTNGKQTKRINCEPFMVGAGRLISKRILKKAGFRSMIVFQSPDGESEYWVNDEEWRNLKEKQWCEMTSAREFMLWDENINEGLDGDSCQRMLFSGATNKCVHLEPGQAYVVDLKSHTNIHTFNDMECDGEAVDVSDIDIPEMANYLEYKNILRPVI